MITDNNVKIKIQKIAFINEGGIGSDKEKFNNNSVSSSKDFLKGILNFFGRNYTLKNIINIQKRLITALKEDDWGKIKNIKQSLQYNGDSDWNYLVDVATFELNTRETRAWVGSNITINNNSKRMKNVLWCINKECDIMANYLINKLPNEYLKNPNAIATIETNNIQLIRDNDLYVIYRNVLP
jgi:hypothetical protein